MFSQSLMLKIGPSKLGHIVLIFVYSGVRVNEAYYYDFLLSQQLLPTVRQVSGEFIFQQDSGLEHRSPGFLALIFHKVV